MRPDPLDGLAHARLEVDRVQVVQQQKAANQLIPGAALGNCRPSRLQQPGQAGAVQLEQDLHQFAGRGADGRLRGVLQDVHQHLDAPHTMPEFLLLGRLLQRWRHSGSVLADIWV